MRPPSSVLRAALTLTVALAANGCGAPTDVGVDAAVVVVEDMLSLVPDGSEAITRRFVGGVWQSSVPEETIPAGVIEAAGMPVVPPGLLPDQDSSVLVLNLFKPRVQRTDSVVVQ